MSTPLTSLQNPRIKSIVRLAKRRERDAKRVTIVEGVREISRALHSGIVPVEAFICPKLVSNAGARETADRLYQLDAERRTHLYEITPEIFARVAYRADSGGMLMLIPYLQTGLAQLADANLNFLAVIEGVEKPGNLGAILRSADGAGVQSIIVCSSQGRERTDLHNPNVIRASLGTLFNMPVAEATGQATLQWLRARTMTLVATTPEAEIAYTDSDMRMPVALLFGSEAHGLSTFWLEAADRQVQIPMAGVADSLNLSASAALLFYEVVRQRNRPRQVDARVNQD